VLKVSALKASDAYKMCFVYYCQEQLLAVDTEAEGFPRKRRFKNNYLQVYIACTVDKWSQWFTVYQEPLLLPLIERLSCAKVMRSPGRWRNVVKPAMTEVINE